MSPSDVIILDPEPSYDDLAAQVEYLTKICNSLYSSEFCSKEHQTLLLTQKAKNFASGLFRFSYLPLNYNIRALSFNSTERRGY
jgi:hypothetical protein